MPAAFDTGLDDIEDIVAKGTSAEDIRHTAGRKHVVPKAKRYGKSVKPDVAIGDSFIPGK